MSAKSRKAKKLAARQPNDTGFFFEDNGTLCYQPSAITAPFLVVANPNSPDMEVRSFDHITECTTFDEAVKHFMEQLLWFDFNYIDIRTNKNQILFESLRP